MTRARLQLRLAVLAFLSLVLFLSLTASLLSLQGTPQDASAVREFSADDKDVVYGIARPNPNAG